MEIIPNNVRVSHWTSGLAPSSNKFSLWQLKGKHGNKPESHLKERTLKFES